MRIWIFDWVGFCLRFYTMELSLFIMFFIFHQYYCHSITGPLPVARLLNVQTISLSVFIGFCAWVVFCSYKQGYAVG